MLVEKGMFYQGQRQTQRADPKGPCHALTLFGVQCRVPGRLERLFQDGEQKTEGRPHWFPDLAAPLKVVLRPATNVSTLGCYANKSGVISCDLLGGAYTAWSYQVHL
jgi:hypothetical protein